MIPVSHPSSAVAEWVTLSVWEFHITCFISSPGGEEGLRLFRFVTLVQHQLFSSLHHQLVSSFLTKTLQERGSKRRLRHSPPRLGSDQ